MADTKIDYKLTKDTEKAISAFAQLVSDTYRSQSRVEEPAKDAGILDRECAQCHRDVAAEMTGHLNEVMRQFNEAMRKAEAEGKVVHVSIGSSTITLDSEENVNRALQSIIDVNHAPDVRREKAYYDKHLEMRALLDRKEAGLRAGREGYFTDLDMARLHTLNKDISDAGEQLGIPEAKRLVDFHRYELRAFESRLKAKENPTPYEERGIGDDARRVALVREWLARDEKRLAAERKKEEEEKALKGKGTPAPGAVPSSGSARPERLPEVPQTLPPPRSLDKMPRSQLQSATREVAGILAGTADFSSDFSAGPAKGAVARKFQLS